MLAEAQPYELIEDTAALVAYVDILSRCPVVAVDIESNSLHHYIERVSLIQITGRTADGVCHHAVVDPFADVDVLLLGPVLADPDVVVIFHGADFDVVSLKRDYGFEINNIYDTMIASRCAGVERFGLADLVKTRFGVTLNKKYQKHDWADRPLSQEALDYAHLDTRYLPEIMDDLIESVEAQGRTDILDEECLLMESRTWAPKADPESAFHNVKGSNKLSADALRILRGMYAWREALACKRDRPSFKVMGAELLLGICSAAPETASELEAVAGRRNRMVKRHGPAILDAVAEAKASTDELPKPKPKARTGSGRRYTKEDEQLFNRLRTWRNERAKTESLEPSMVVGNQVLKEVSVLRPKNVDALKEANGIRQWQIFRYGGILVDHVAEFEAVDPA